MPPTLIKPIYIDADYRAALARAKAIFQAQPGAPELDELDALAMQSEDYEAQHYPMLP